MPEVTTPAPRFGPPSRGVTAGDVERAADALLRTGERPTIDKVRQKLGSGSPNTINPLLDAWWKRLSARLDSGPAAFHRLPESVAHVAEALWMQALDEGRRRAQLELKSKERTAADQQQTLEVRSHVLSLREGELDSRLRDRDNTITTLNQQLRELTLLLRKDQATRDAQGRRITALEAQLVPAASAVATTPERKPGRKIRERLGAGRLTPTLEQPLLARRQPRNKPPRARTPPAVRTKNQTRRAGPLRRPKPITAQRKTAKKRPPAKKKQLHQHLATVIAKAARMGRQ